VFSRLVAQSKRSWDANLTELVADDVVRGYLWALLCSHAVIIAYWSVTDRLSILRSSVEPLCWPYFSTCWMARFESADGIAMLLLAEVALLGSAAWALVCRFIKTYLAIMVALNICLFVIMSLDYRLRSTEFYMLFWLNAVVLGWPAKRWSIPILLVSFYFWAATLKLNTEWLSGAALYHDLYIIPHRYAWIACSYVVILELILSWGLIAKRRWVVVASFAQFALFHVESLSQIYWFYPLLMATFLSWFVIEFIIGGRHSVSFAAAFWRGNAPRSVYVLAAIFAVCQGMPYLYRGDKTLTGQGSLFTLHMFEARQVCDVSAIIHHSDRVAETVDLLMAKLPPRMICDPIVYFDRMTNLCRSLEMGSTQTTVDFIMRSRRSSDASMTTVVDEADFCSKGERYSMLSNNDWMR